MASGQIDHYLGLDLLRGVAALGVVWFHCATRLDLPGFFAHGYLAVDFFFVLSGFVLARAYGTRLAERRLSLGRFAVMRIVRLMPLIVLGTAIAATLEIGRPGVSDQHRHMVDAARAVLSGIFLVPTLGATTLEHAVFPLNGPTWSLSLEAVASAAFAVWALAGRRPLVLVLVLALSAAFVLYGDVTYGEIGFGALPDSFWLGFARLGWSFAAGMLLYRFRDRAPKAPFILPTALLILVMLVPIVGDWNAAFDAVCVFCVLPWIVWAASTVRFGSSGRRWSAWSGDLSYPIYALHYPVIRFFGVVGLKLGLAGRIGVAVVATGVVVTLAWAAYRFFDAPLRRRLMATFAPRKPRTVDL